MTSRASSAVPAVQWIGPAKALPYEHGQEPAVVKMRMRQDDRVQLRRLEREWHAVANRLVRAALEHPAVDEDLGSAGVEQELGTGDGRCAAEEVQVHPEMVPPRAVRACGPPVCSGRVGFVAVRGDRGGVRGATRRVRVPGRGAPSGRGHLRHGTRLRRAAPGVRDAPRRTRRLRTDRAAALRFDRLRAQLDGRDGARRRPGGGGRHRPGGGTGRRRAPATHVPALR